ncbi:Pr6Pr family membrane protein [Nocardioides sp.]|uniref:Pr6Pr family membrane protein n=1 Tax=Nocardioides sp. TaxID=35761 RepID=UPI00356451B1
MTRARACHAATAVVAWTAIVVQLVLVIQGGAILDEVNPPTLPLRVGRFFSYFTIQSNILVAVTATQLARNPGRDGTWWRPVRLAALVGITVTGVVHFFLLRPLLDLDGADFVADKLLHMVVPVIAIACWAVFGPRPRVTWREIGLALCWPLVWLAWTLIMGAASGWYPYPFLDHREDGGAIGVVVTSIGITAFFLVLFVLARWIDQRTQPAPRVAAD